MGEEQKILNREEQRILDELKAHLLTVGTSEIDQDGNPSGRTKLLMDQLTVAMHSAVYEIARQPPKAKRRWWNLGR